MRTLPPKYSDIELQALLEAQTKLPEKIQEEDFLNEIKNNFKIRWDVNRFLFRKTLLPLLLDKTTFNKWKYFKRLNWLLTLIVVGFAIWKKNLAVLLFLIPYPFLIITFDHWIFLFNMSVIIGIKLLFKINIPYFWFFTAIVTAGYLLNKAIGEMIEKRILANALKDWTTFWKYYSGGIISMDETFSNENDRLTKKFPELLTNKAAASSLAPVLYDE